MKVYLPSSIDIDSHLERFPPVGVTAFEKDRLVYILSLLLSIPANNKEIAEREAGWVPILSSILARKVKNYKQYLDYALGENYPDNRDSALIEANKQYIVDKVSKRYRFKPRLLATSDIKEVELKNTNLNKGEKKEAIERRKVAAKAYPNLVKYFNSNLKIDADNAKAYAVMLTRRYELEKNEIILRSLNEASLNTSSGWNFSSPEHQYMTYLYNINRIEEGSFFMSVDSNVRRFHSNITNLKKELRAFITYEGHQLVNIDLKNSQPFLSLALFNPKFYNKLAIKSSTLEELGGYSIKRNTRKFHVSRVAPEIFETLKATSAPAKFSKTKIKNSSPITLLDTLIMFSNHIQESDIEDYNKFKVCVSNGQFYETLGQLMKEKLGGEAMTRDKVKTVVFQVLFTDNSYFVQEDAAPKRLFAETFPTVYEMFKLIKTSEKNALARLLQSIESWLILDKVCSKVTKINPQLPIFTIHDSVVTVKGYEVFVKEIMEREVEKAIGIKPALDISYFDAEPRLLELRQWLSKSST